MQNYTKLNRFGLCVTKTRFYNISKNISSLLFHLPTFGIHYTQFRTKNIFRPAPPTRMLQFSNGTLLFSTVTRDKFISRTHLFSVTHFHTMTWLMVHIFFSSSVSFFVSILLMPHQIHTDLRFHYQKGFYLYSLLIDLSKIKKVFHLGL